MSFVTSTHILGRSSRCLVQTFSAGVGPSARAVLRQPFRQATTTAKPRVKKTASSSSEEAAAVPKKTITTKSTSATSTRAPRKKKLDAQHSEPAAAETPVVKKNIRAASTKSTVSSSVKKGPNVDTTTQRFASRSKPATETEEGAWGAFRPAHPAELPPKPPQPVDMKSKEFKRASRQWTGLMVGLPFLFVTSYYLYDRRELPRPPSGLRVLSDLCLYLQSLSGTCRRTCQRCGHHLHNLPRLRHQSLKARIRIPSIYRMRTEISSPLVVFPVSSAMTVDCLAGGHHVHDRYVFSAEWRSARTEGLDRSSRPSYPRRWFTQEI